MKNTNTSKHSQLLVLKEGVLKFMVMDGPSLIGSGNIGIEVNFVQLGWLKIVGYD